MHIDIYIHQVWINVVTNLKSNPLSRKRSLFFQGDLEIVTDRNVVHYHSKARTNTTKELEKKKGGGFKAVKVNCKHKLSTVPPLFKLKGVIV